MKSVPKKGDFSLFPQPEMPVMLFVMTLAILAGAAVAVMLGKPVAGLISTVFFVPIIAATVAAPVGKLHEKIYFGVLADQSARWSEQIRSFVAAGIEDDTPETIRIHVSIHRSLIGARFRIFAAADGAGRYPRIKGDDRALVRRLRRDLAKEIGWLAAWAVLLYADQNQIMTMPGLTAHQRIKARARARGIEKPCGLAFAAR